VNLKLFIQSAIVIGLTAIAAFFVFWTGSVELEPVSQTEVQAAMDLLHRSLHNPRYTYVDFLTDNAHLRGQTPSFSASIPVNTVLGDNESFVKYVTVPQRGLYSFSLEYELPPRTFNNLIISIDINDERQFEEAATIALPVFWESESKDFPLNRFGDEITPTQVQIPGMQRVELFDAGFTTDLPLKFLLEAGENRITLTNETSRDIRIGELGVFSEIILQPNPNHGRPQSRELITVRAIYYTHKNSPFTQLEGWRDPSLYPFHPIDRRMNVLSVGEVGDEVFFTVDVPETGYYALTLHAITDQDDFSTFVTIRVNGEIPFKEAVSFPLVPFRDQRWRNQTIADADGEPLLFHLQAGENVISVRTELAPIAMQLRQLHLLIDHINHFSLEIRRVTGREIDRNRTWRLTRYIPNTQAYLEAYHIIFRDMINQLAEFSPRGNNSGVANNMITAISLLDRMLERPDELPLFFSVLNGSGGPVMQMSVLQMAGESMDALVDAGMTLSAIHIGRSYDLPRERAPMYERLWAGTQNLIASYTSDKFVVRNREDAVNVWVNHSYLHVDILQRLVDTRFTPETGIHVNLSVMPDVTRLIMARAAGTNPDVALGVPAFMPFEMGSRGALYELSGFDDFWYFMGNLVPGAAVGYIFNESVFAIPETAGFWTTVYRTDILEPLGLEAPDTWQDVAEMQSVLRRFDMSFYKPIASGIGYKWFFQTSPLIYQNDGLLFSPDGLSTAIDQPPAVEALTFLGDLFTTFALDEQVPSFFNAFRFGQNPVGILDPATYMLLVNAAPELLGQWNIAPFPGTVQENGDIWRYYIANGTGAIMFDNTDLAPEAWEFLKWYLSAETQIDFAMALMANFNILWVSANVDALQEMPIDYRHRQAILESINWLRDVPRSPGQYMLERRLSDIWNTMVFEGTPAQVAIDLRVIDINREFTRKMIEFGFVDSAGNKLQPYVVRELDWVRYMIEQAVDSAQSTGR